MASKFLSFLFLSFLFLHSLADGADTGGIVLLPRNSGVETWPRAEASFRTELRYPRQLERELLQATSFPVDATVALDGSGNFSTITQAVASAPDNLISRYIIYVKAGVYKEVVEVTKPYIMLVGDGMDRTIITGSRSNGSGWNTHDLATFGVVGSRFIARDITFENTAGPENHQAVAFRSDSDMSVLFNCAIRGYQDTLYARSKKQFYRECVITGTVDFIFGDASAVFQNCTITARKGMAGQQNTITAHGRKTAGDPSGFSIQFCTISAEPGATDTYLGRPWKLFSRTIVMQSSLSGISPRGWLEWNGMFALNTLYYGEYQNHGPAAAVDQRVTWPGFHVIIDANVARSYTVAEFISGDKWLPAMRLNYYPGLVA